MKVVFADGKVATWEAKEGEGGWLQTKAPHTAENVGKKKSASATNTAAIKPPPGFSRAAVDTSRVFPPSVRLIVV